MILKRFVVATVGFSYSQTMQSSTVVSTDNATSMLQQSLDNLAIWAKERQLSINISKCAVVSLSSKPQPASSIYDIDGIAIPRRDSYVDLGITVSSGLSFDLNINNIVSKARQRVGTLFCGFLSHNLSTMRLAFITYVRPISRASAAALSTVLRTTMLSYGNMRFSGTCPAETPQQIKMKFCKIDYVGEVTR
jgi:hypothetical protein